MEDAMADKKADKKKDKGSPAPPTAQKLRDSLEEGAMRVDEGRLILYVAWPANWAAGNRETVYLTELVVALQAAKVEITTASRVIGLKPRWFRRPEYRYPNHDGIVANAGEVLKAWATLEPEQDAVGTVSLIVANSGILKESDLHLGAARGVHEVHLVTQGVRIPIHHTGGATSPSTLQKTTTTRRKQ
jgi:hypothetical protein